MPKPKDAPRFPGFAAPSYTQMPNIVLDDLLADLSGAEWKVLAYLLRRTSGWHKDDDDISLQQLTTGMPGHNRGTGLSKSTVVVALQSLEDWGLIERTQHRDATKGDRPTNYRVRLSDTPVSDSQPDPCPIIGHPRVRQSDTQKNQSQKKKQKTVPHAVNKNGASPATPDPLLNQQEPLEDDEQFAWRFARDRGLERPDARRLAVTLTQDGKLRRAAFLAALPPRPR